MEKTTNYTPEQTIALVNAYTSGTTVETLAENFGKSVRSIVAKLSREGVYQKKVYTTKTGDTPLSKDVLADKIGSWVGLSESEIDSLTKCNKTALQKILEKVALTV